MINRKQRHKRIRAKISGTAKTPRLAVFRSSMHIYAQLIDDDAQRTLAAFSDAKLKDKGTKSDKAKKVGLEIAKIAKEKNIESVIFDRGGHQFHGRIKNLADGAREGGLKF